MGLPVKLFLALKYKTLISSSKSTVSDILFEKGFSIYDITLGMVY